MARFVLQSCKLRGDRFVPTQEDLLTLEWGDLRLKLAPTSSQQALLTLRGTRAGSFVGLIRHPRTGSPTTFRFENHSGSESIGWLTRINPTFTARLIAVYRVISAEWEGSCYEYPGEVSE